MKPRHIEWWRLAPSAHRYCHAVKYLIVGGYAFGVHAEPRATKLRTAALEDPL
jgi:hypothetical protein